MALQFVGSRIATYSGFTSGTQTVSLGGLTGGIVTSPSAGDLILISYSIVADAVGGSSPLVTDGDTNNTYTVLGTIYGSGTTYRTRSLHYWKISTGDSSFHIAPTGNAAWPALVVIQVWRGVWPANPIGNFVVSSDNSTTLADPPIIATTIPGSAVAAFGVGAFSSAAADYASSLTSFKSARRTGTGVAGVIGMGYSPRPSPGGYNPAAFTGATTGAGASYSALSIVIQPEPEYIALNPPRVSNARTFYPPAVTTRNMLSPPRVPLAAARLPTVTTRYHLTAPRVGNGLAPYPPVVSQGDVLRPPRVPNGLTIYLPTVTPGPVTLSPPRVGIGRAVRPPVVTARYTLTAPRVGNGLTPIPPASVKTIIPVVTPPERTLSFEQSRLTGRTLQFAPSRVSARAVSFAPSRRAERTVTLVE